MLEGFKKPMSSLITILKNITSTPPGKKYQLCEIGYKTEEGKVKGMRVVSFGDQKAVFDVASAAKAGDVLEANFRQNDKGYWEFASLAATDKKASVTVDATVKGTPVKSNFETPDERAARQVLIVRQSSLSNAIAFSNLINNDKADLEDIVAIAKVFEGYVLGKPAVTGEVE